MSVYTPPSAPAPARARASSTPAKAPAPAKPPAPTEARSADQIRKLFPQYAFLLNIPEVAAILSNTTDYPDAQSISNALAGTQWWQTTQPSVRTYEQLQATDPQGYQQQLRTKDAQVQDLYAGIGLKADPNVVQGFADQALKFGWSDQQLVDAVTGGIQWDPSLLNQAGTLGLNYSKMKTMANDYMVSFNDWQAFDAAKRIISGEQTPENFTEQFQQAAKSKFSYSPEIQAAIDRGTTPSQYFQPYQSEIAKQLEVSPDSIDFMNNTKWQSVTDYVDPNNGQRRPMTISEAATFARKDSSFQYTRQANTQASALLSGLGQEFGFQGAPSSNASGNFSGVASYG